MSENAGFMDHFSGTAAQAIHWFDIVRFHREVRRVAAVWPDGEEPRHVGWPLAIRAGRLSG